MPRAALGLLVLAIWIAPASAQDATLSEEEIAKLYLNLAYGAINDGDRDAQWLVGLGYETGYRVKQQSYPIATQWYFLSAMQGHVEAQEKLGAAYALGRGVLRDYVQAYKWFSLAAIGLSGEAFKRASISLNLLVAELSSSQLADAEQLAKAWRPVTFVKARKSLVEEFYPQNANCRDAWTEMFKLLYDVECLPN